MIHAEILSRGPSLHGDSPLVKVISKNIILFLQGSMTSLPGSLVWLCSGTPPETAA